MSVNRIVSGAGGSVLGSSVKTALDLNYDDSLNTGQTSVQGVIDHIMTADWVQAIKVSFDALNVPFTASNVQEALEKLSESENISYDSSQSPLITAQSVKEAINQISSAKNIEYSDPSSTGNDNIDDAVSYIIDTAIAEQAEAFAENLRQFNLANDGQAALTTQFVLDDGGGRGRLQLGSADDDNFVTVTRTDGSLEKFSMSIGETKNLDNCLQGTKIESTKGVTGASSTRGDSPSPLGSQAFAARVFKFYAFRNSQNSGNAVGNVFCATGAVPSEITLKNVNGDIVQQNGQDTILVPKNSVRVLTTNGNNEFTAEGTQPFFCSIVAGNGPSSTAPLDSRLIVPPSTKIIGHAQNCRVSAVEPDTTVTFYQRNGNTGTFVLQPGTPVNLPVDTSAIGATNYGNDAYTILSSDKPIAAFSGADSHGGEATCFFDVNSLSQRVPLPLATGTSGDAGQASISIASLFKGTARIYEIDNDTKEKTLVQTLPLTRSGGDQKHPCAARWTPGAQNYKGGYVESDVPIYVVLNSENNDLHIPGGVHTQDDEINFIGITPDNIRASFTKLSTGLIVNNAYQRKSISLIENGTPVETESNIEISTNGTSAISDTAASSIGLLRGHIETQHGKVRAYIGLGHYEKDAAVTLKFPSGTFSEIIAITNGRNTTEAQYEIPVRIQDQDTIVIDRENTIDGDTPISIIVDGYE